MGGEVFAREALEKAAQEGGEKLVQKLASQTIAYGPALLIVAKSSPSRFISTFAELSPAMQKAAAQAITREPDSMARLFSSFGSEALTAAAKHPGVSTQVMEALGAEGVETLGKITTDQAIQLSRLAPQLAKAAEPERRTLMEMIGKAPGKIMDLLEAHPKILASGTLLTAWVASKDKLLGSKTFIGFDANGKPVFAEDQGFLARLATSFKGPLSGIIGIIGVAVAGYAAVRIWATYRVARTKVRLKEAELSRDAKLP